jgi:hypothetical protein
LAAPVPGVPRFRGAVDAIWIPNISDKSSLTSTFVRSRPTGIEIGMRTDGCDEMRGKVAPVAEVWWKRGPDLGGAEFEEPVTRAPGKSAFEPAHQLWRELGVAILGRE